MLGATPAAATIAVKDLSRAREFYGRTLGLKAQEGDEEGVAAYRSGQSTLFVYESEYAGTNKATAATWVVDDVDSEVEALKAKGVGFEHYDMPGMKLEGDIHVSGDLRAAWFKDPDGNILALVSQ